MLGRLSRVFRQTEMEREKRLAKNRSFLSQHNAFSRKMEGPKLLYHNYVQRMKVIATKSEVTLCTWNYTGHKKSFSFIPVSKRKNCRHRNKTVRIKALLLRCKNDYFGACFGATSAALRPATTAAAIDGRNKKLKF